VGLTTPFCIPYLQFLKCGQPVNSGSPEAKATGDAIITKAASIKNPSYLICLLIEKGQLSSVD
jgi:hypothetical protein